MTTSMEVDVLPHADGSARYSSQGISVLASVNGPVEVSRRDELPDAATIEVAVRPSAGLAGIRERFFEGLIHKTLKQVIRTNHYPRTLIQVTLQITASPDIDATSGRPNQAASLLYLLPPLLNAAMLALLCSSIPLSTIVSSTIISVASNDSILTLPSVKQVQTAKSSHVVTYSSKGDLILVESEGSFNIDILESCVNAGRVQCVGGTSGGDTMDTTDITLLDTFKQSIETRIQKGEQWREHLKG